MRGWWPCIERWWRGLCRVDPGIAGCAPPPELLHETLELAAQIERDGKAWIPNQNVLKLNEVRPELQVFDTENR